MSAPTRAEYLQGAFSHEMTHTRLLVAINRRVRELARRNDLVYPINDDVIQAEFLKTPGFEAAFTRERDQFYRAALEPDPGRRRDFAAKALEMVRYRHARFFTGPTAVYAELESLFLTMEGVGQWAAYRLAHTRAGGNDAEALRLGLRASPLFEGLGEEQLLAIIREFRLLSFDPGDVILTEGEPGQSLLARGQAS